MTQQETVDTIVHEVLKRFREYDDGILCWEPMTLFVRTIVNDNVQKFFDANSIDIHEVDLFDENDEPGEYVDDEES